jgi:hypothetical protein
MEDHIVTQFKIWGVVFLGEMTAFNLNAGAQAFMYCCAGLASLATAYYYVFIKK